MVQLLKNITLIFLMLVFVNAHAQKKYYMNSKLPINQRVDDLLGRMTLEEKVGQMCQYVGIQHMKQVEKWHIEGGVDTTSDAFGFYKGFPVDSMKEYVKKGLVGSFLHVFDWKEANELQKLAEESKLGIPLLIATDAIHGHGMYKPGATIFPSPIGLASSWDTILVKKVAQATAMEMRASGYHWTFSPNVDVARDARWGRVGETFGEDPELAGIMGIMMVKGYQGNGFAESNNVISCAKHFIAGSQPSRGLNSGPMDVSTRSLYETWLPPFIDAMNAGAYTVMAAHNEINGVPCHSNKKLLSDILRNDLGFKGFIVSDWTDIARLSSLHKVAKTRKEADYLAVKAGINMHMHGPEFFKNVVQLVKDGKIALELIDESVKKILYAKFQLGLFENRYVNQKRVEQDILSNANKQLALDAARKSIVLLKNKDNFLPIKKDIESIFLTGPNSANQAILGDWAKPQPKDNIITVKEGIEQIISKKTRLLYQPVENIKAITNEEISQAVLKAEQAEVAVIVVGSHSLRHEWDKKTCGENADRSKLGLFGRQLELIKKVYATGTPTVVVLVNGRPLAIEWCKQNIPSIIEAWEPGMYGGTAIAETIFGDNNPSGKLPISFPVNVGQIPCFYNHKPSAYFRSYIDHETKVLYPFGHGLSYTKFHYSNLMVSDSIHVNDTLTINVKVKNEGQFDGFETVIVYVNDKFSSVTTPVKKMIAFRRIFLEKQEEKTVSFQISTDDLTLLDAQMERKLETGVFEVIVAEQKIEFVVFDNTK